MSGNILIEVLKAQRNTALDGGAQLATQLQVAVERNNLLQSQLDQANQLIDAYHKAYPEFRVAKEIAKAESEALGEQQN